MRRAYLMQAEKLNVYFGEREAKWREHQKDINNPKIPLKFVMDEGELVYTDQKKLDLENATAIRRARAKNSADRRATKKRAQAELVALLGDDKLEGDKEE